ncbi:UreD urease accessory protein [Coleophoma cylindrospora]|uniref:UreD urease accessory protein n=1 Tax=Coleophoma cylindrospora TaxID=1849047 RepID=A0A3D8SQM3_9HELO|nr:UreD urease accessory protein [Coleophoma cylindrospora]
MISPFPPSSSRPGNGSLTAHLLPHSISALSKITFQYPLKLISPSPSANQKSVLVFLLTYGGGLVGGDQVLLNIDVKPKARLSIVTQGHTKVFKSTSRDIVTRQRLDVSIEMGAALCLLPDPVQPFEGSVYEQLQKFTLAGGASICLLDWVSAGRTARGENWDFHAWSGRNELWTASAKGEAGRMLLRDNIFLDGNLGSGKERLLKHRMQNMSIYGTLILNGPLMESLAAFFMSEFSGLPRIGARDFRSQANVDIDSEMKISRQESWRRDRLQLEKDDGLLWSAAKVRGCTVIKFGSRTVEGARVWIGSMLKEEGSISEHFGEEATMCVR